MRDVVAKRHLASIGDIAGLVEEGSREPRLETGAAHGLHQQKQVIGPVAGHHRVGMGSLKLGDDRREVLDLIDVVEDGLDNFVAPLVCVALYRVLHVLAPGIVLVDGVDARAECSFLLHDLDQGADPHGRRRRHAEAVELALLAGQLQSFRAVIDVHDLLVRVAQIIFAHVFGQLPADRRGGPLHDHVYTVGDDLLELRRRAAGGASIVIFGEDDLLAVISTFGVRLVDHELDRGRIHPAGGCLRAGTAFQNCDL